jgi:hypothetical protein
MSRIEKRDALVVIVLLLIAIALLIIESGCMLNTGTVVTRSKDIDATSHHSPDRDIVLDLGEKK